MPRSRVARAAALAGLLAVVAAGCGDDDEPMVATESTTTTTAATTTTSPGPTSDAVPRTVPAARVIEVAFAGGKVSGGVRTEAVPLGETVVLRVTSDVVDHVHVHTYDLTADVGPGRAGEIEIDATIPGRHEVELEERGRALLTLEVS